MTRAEKHSQKRLLVEALAIYTERERHARRVGDAEELHEAKQGRERTLVQLDKVGAFKG